jgi:hypothetical protein
MNRRPAKGAGFYPGGVGRMFLLTLEITQRGPGGFENSLALKRGHSDRLTVDFSV